MQAFEQSIYPELAEFGGVRRLSGVLDEPSYEVGGMVMETPGGWRYNATLTNTGEAILLQGEVSAVATTECARCLEPATVEVSAELQGYFLLDEAELAQGYEEDEVDAVDAACNFDISYNILASLCYATPFVVLCKDDCKGLCPHCGQDLNEGSCDCSQKPDPLNPFAALAGLSFSDDDVARGQAAAQEYGDAVASLPPEELPELSPEEAAELEKALSAIFEDGAEGYLEFDEQGNLVFIEEEPEEPGE